MQKLHNFSKLYFFEHSHINRPLWTYIAQEKGSQIYSYYYSGTTSSLVFDNSIPRSPTPMFKNLNWPNYLFWDKYQAKFLKDFCYEPFKFHISGPLCKQIKSLDKSLIRKRSIAVFDISPRRDSLWIKSAQPNVYYTPEHFLPFFEDIIFLCQKYEIQMIIKLKRNFKKSSDLHPSYRNLLSRIRGNKNVLFVHPSTAPYPLINATRCSITMPFTSTPIISSLIKKPVCYYDPNSYVNRLDSEARGLDIIIGVRELENWILRYLD